MLIRLFLVVVTDAGIPSPKMRSAGMTGETE